MTAAAARRLYTFGWYLALPWVVAYLLLRSLRQPRYRRNWRERFLGLGPLPEGGRAAASAGAQILWLHAVSVGETRAAQPLIERLAGRYPHAQFVLTHMTPTGREAALPVLQALAGAHAALAGTDAPGRRCAVCGGGADAGRSGPLGQAVSGSDPCHRQPEIRRDASAGTARARPGMAAPAGRPQRLDVREHARRRRARGRRRVDGCDPGGGIGSCAAVRAASPAAI